MTNFKAIDYQGPSRLYKPPIGQLSATAPLTSTVPPNNGYYNLDYLKGLLDQLITDCSNLYTSCENSLGDFALMIDPTDTDLTQAHDLAYPGDTTPDSITFDEYKYILLNSTSNAAQYVLTAYQKAVSGPGGSNAVDISNIALVVNNESKRIKEFLDGYIGDLNDTSEHRTVELFQDWAENAAIAIQRLRTQAESATPGVPESEVAGLTQETAIKLQALYRVQLNPFNKLIEDTFAKLMKNWESTSALFYAKHLGPGIQFQLKVGQDLFGNLSNNDMPTLAADANGITAALNENFRNVLADQMKRNSMFEQYTSALWMNIAQRDSITAKIKQLASIGKPIAEVFTDAASISQDDTILQADHPLIAATQSNDFAENFTPAHSELAGLLDDAAHPQYLLRSGGLDSIITGDIVMAGGVAIGGIIPGKHKHNGSDGSAKISGADIELNSISEEQIDVTSTTPIPNNLRIQNSVPLINPTGINTVTIQISFDIDDANVAGYEFEIVELI